MGPATNVLNPNKLYECLAAGVTVVTLNFSVDVQGFAPWIRIAEDRARFVAVGEALAQPMDRDVLHAASRPAKLGSAGGGLRRSHPSEHGRRDAVSETMTPPARAARPAPSGPAVRVGRGRNWPWILGLILVVAVVFFPLTFLERSSPRPTRRHRRGFGVYAEAERARARVPALESVHLRRHPVLRRPRL